MEDILASIKRIIADDGAAALNASRGRSRPARGDAPAIVPPGPTPTPPAATEPAPPEVLELTDAVTPAAHHPEPPSDEALAAPADSTPADTAAATRRVTEQPQPAAPPVTEQPAPAATLVSQDAAIASRQALAALSSIVVRPAAGQDVTLDALVREMLRPMLKEWLDQRLPELVEGLVAREIARITGGSL